MDDDHVTRAGRRKWGSLVAKTARALELPLGPATVDELYKWPERVAVALTVDELHRIQNLLLTKMVVTSDFSGMDCYREAMEITLSAVENQFAMKLPPNCMRFARTCDFSKLTQKVLVAYSKQCKRDDHDQPSSCVFNELNDRLVPGAVSLLDAMERYLKSYSEVCSEKVMAQSYSEVVGWLRLNKCWAYSGVSPCLVHDRRCPTHPGAAHDASSSQADVLHPSKRMKKEADIYRPLFINTSGMTCKAWTSVGEQRQFADKSERAFGIWVVERQDWAQKCMEDIFFAECTVRFPVKEKLADMLDETHEVIWIITGPQFLGWPHIRPRMFCAGINKATMAWVGPSSAKETQDMFKHKFYQATQLTGDDLFCGSEEEMYEHYRDLARTQGNIVSVETLKSLSEDDLLHAILAPDQLQIFKEYKNLEQEISPGIMFLGDLQQHPGMASSAGEDWPCRLTHGSVMSFRTTLESQKPRLATGLEHLGAQGFHLFPATTKDYPLSKMSGIFRGLKQEEQKQLSGNGMHLAVIGSWVYFVLGNVMRIDSGVGGVYARRRQ